MDAVIRWEAQGPRLWLDGVEVPGIAGLVVRRSLAEPLRIELVLMPSTVTDLTPGEADPAEGASVLRLRGDIDSMADAPPSRRALLAQLGVAPGEDRPQTPRQRLDTTERDLALFYESIADRRPTHSWSRRPITQRSWGCLMDTLALDLCVEHGVDGHPKARRCFEIAWKHGHASGISEVASYFAELVELIK